MNIALWSTLFTYAMLYISFVYNQKLSPLHCYFGVYIPEKLTSSNQGKAIFKDFLVQSTFCFIGALVISLAFIFTEHFTTGLFSLFTCVQLLLYFMFYVLAHKKVKAFKATLPESTPKVAKMVIDTDFVAEKNRLKRRYSYLYSLPLGISILTAIYLFENYHALPEFIPTHWNYLGQADSWSAKSVSSVITLILAQVFFTLLFAFCSRSQWGARSKGSQKSNAFKCGHMKYLKSVSLSLYGLTLFFVSFMSLNAYAMVHGTDLNIFAIILCGILPFICVIYLLYAYFKYERPSLHTTKDMLQYLPEDHDKYWLLGFLYCNPGDSALFVEKRYGLGWTLNIGTLPGKIIGSLLLLLIVLSIGASIIVSVPFA